MTAGSPPPANPKEPPRTAGGLKLPPIPQEEEFGTDRSRLVAPKESAPKEPGPASGSTPFAMLFIGLLLGLLGGAGATYALWIWEIEPGLEARPTAGEKTDTLARLDGRIVDLQAQLEALRSAQLKSEQQMQEVRQVVATITVQTSNQLNEARNDAQKAKNDLESLKIEAALNKLNQLFDEARLPLAVNQATVTPSEVQLHVSYWGFMVTERETLDNLTHFAAKLDAAFPGKQYPGDYVITFTSIQSGRSATFRRGQWETPH